MLGNNSTRRLKNSLFSYPALIALFFVSPTPLQAEDIKFDYDGDKKADFAVRRPQTFHQFIRSSNDETTESLIFGKRNNDIPITGDFDGDGIYDIAVRRASNQTWYIKNSSGVDTLTGYSDGVTRLRFGTQISDIPVPADYDGDGKTDIAVRRPDTQFWYIKNSSGVDGLTGHNDGVSRIQFGKQSSDVPVPADYDGDGKADVAVRRPSTQTWYIKNSSGVDTISGNTDGITRKAFGLRSSDIAIPADYDGDGKADLAVRRPSTFQWFILNSTGTDSLTQHSDGVSRITFGRSENDIPVVADYDGDGKADIAVRRPSTQFWYVLNSSGLDNQTNHNDGISRLRFGSNETDIPLAMPTNSIWNISDIDNDGLTNAQEYAQGTAIDNPDSDNDGLTDGEEVNLHYTNPLDNDSDQDGVDDGIEINLGTNPNFADEIVEFTQEFVSTLSGALGYGDRVRDGYLSNVLDAYNFKEDNTGTFYLNDLYGYSSSHAFNWQVDDSKTLILNNFELNSRQLQCDSLHSSLASHFDSEIIETLWGFCISYGYSLDETIFSYGLSHAQWTLSDYSGNKLNLTINSTMSYKLEIPQSIIDKLGSDWTWGNTILTEVPMETETREFITQEHSIFTNVNDVSLTGFWALPLFYELPQHDPPFIDTATFMMDMVEFSEGTASSTLSELNFEVSSSEDSFTLSNDNETLVFTPLQQISQSYLVRVDRFVNDQLSHIYVAQMIKKDEQQSSLVQSPETELPFVYAYTKKVTLNESLENGLIPLDKLIAQQFISDGLMKRNIFYDSYDENATEFYFFRNWSWQKDEAKNQLIHHWQNNIQKRVRYWEILDVNDAGIISLFSYELFSYDYNQDDIYTSDEAAHFITPRIETIELIDLSAYGEIWLQSDFDDDGLTTEQETELGTNPDAYDSDNDGFSDSDELLAMTDPNDSSSVPLLANQVNFADPGLTDCLSNIDSMVVSVTSINCSNDNIESLEGLEVFTYLEHLALNLNQISDLTPISGLTLLKSLELYKNQISDINALSEMNKLEVLYLEENSIEEINGLANKPNMTFLYLKGNEVTNLSPLSNSTSLLSLDVSNNKLTSISSLSSLPSLDYLNLTGNEDIPCEEINNLERTIYPITIVRTTSCPVGELIDFSVIADENLKSCIESTNYEEISDIRWLDCSNRNIVQLNGIEQFFALSSLVLDNNAITDIQPFSGLERLSGLYMDGNHLTSLTGLESFTEFNTLSFENNSLVDISALQNLTEISTLNLNSNNVSDISALSGLQEVDELFLDNNQVTDLSPLANLEFIEYLTLKSNGLTNLSTLPTFSSLYHLDLTNNEIDELTSFSGFEALQHLYLSNNTIKDINHIAELVQLRKLRLGGNQISNLSALTDFENLRELSLSSNLIEDISPISNNIYLSALYMSNNDISDLSAISNFSRLRSLWAMENRITDIAALTNLKSIEILMLTDNQITDLTMLPENSNTYAISLAHNQITDPSPLAKYQYLTWLNLEDNQITELTGFESLTWLQFLNLGNNQIRELSALQSGELEELYLYNNQLESIEHLYEFDDLEVLDLSDNSNLTCSSLELLQTALPSTTITLPQECVN